MKNLIRMMVGLVIFCLATTASAQLFKPLSKPVLPNASAPGVSQKVPIPQELGQANVQKVFNIWPGFDCVAARQAVRSPLEGDKILGAVEMGASVKVLGNPASSAVTFKQDFILSCPVRVPPGSIITRVEAIGAKNGVEGSGSKVSINLFQRMADGSFDTMSFPYLHVEKDGAFDVSAQGALTVNAEGYPVVVNIQQVEPAPTPNLPNFPKGWDYEVRLIKVFYE